MTEVKPASCPEKSQLPKPSGTRMHGHPTWRHTRARFSCYLPLMDLDASQEFLQLHQLLKGIARHRGRRDRRGLPVHPPVPVNAEQGGPCRPRDIFASRTHLIRPSLSEPVTLHSFSRRSCKADAKTSAKRKKSPADFRVEKCQSSGAGASTLSTSTSCPPGM